MKIDLHRISASVIPDTIPKEALTCEEAKKAEHPMTQCMKDQGTHSKEPGAFCHHFLEDVCDLERGKDFGQRKNGGTMAEKFAGLSPDQIMKSAAHHGGPFKVGDRVVVEVDPSIKSNGLQGSARRRAMDYDGRKGTVVEVGDPANLGDPGGPFPPYWIEFDPIEPGQRPEKSDVAWHHHELTAATSK